MNPLAASERGPLRSPRVLVVDDDAGMREDLAAILETDGLTVDSAQDGPEALAQLEAVSYQAALLDIQLPGMGGLEVLRRIKERFPDVEVVMVTVQKEIPTVVEAMRLGAADFLTKDFRPGELKLKTRQALARHRAARKLAYLEGELETELERQDTSRMVMGQSPAMRALGALLEKVAPLPATLLILGESGTGKELLARRVHRMWSAAQGAGGARGGDRPFVAVNLAAIPGELMEASLFGHEKGAFTGATGQRLGKFELADGGTLFLDEIGELKLELQTKLLRAIQEREVERVGGRRPVPVDVRLIAATHVDLKKAVEAGTFRQDLYYRIHVIPLQMPPLRERTEDIPALAQRFLHEAAREFRRAQVPSLSPEALRALEGFPWPGNVRELRNVIERLVATVDRAQITDTDLPMELHYPRLWAEAKDKTDGLAHAVTAFERSFIAMTLARTGWHRKRAAAELGIGYSTLKKKLKQLGLSPGEDEEDE